MIPNAIKGIAQLAYAKENPKDSLALFMRNAT